MKKLILINFFLLSVYSSMLEAQQKYVADTNYNRAVVLLNQIDKFYLVNDGKVLYRENYPHDEKYQASYLAQEEQASNAYSYLWPFSGSLSAYVTLLEKSSSKKVKATIDQQVLKGLGQYYDTRSPAAYSSYITSADLSDRFYDDNIWLGIDFVDLYLLTKQKAYLNKAKDIWTFIESGMDNKLGGGIYWVEQNKNSKNTCSNAPGTVYLLKLYQATKEQNYLSEAKNLYKWTKEILMDPKDNLYWDNIAISGNVDKAKYAYNTGQMIQAASLLYQITDDKKYLADAQASAKAAYNYFFDHSMGLSYPVLKKTDNWFIAVMLRGFVELYHIDNNKEYIQAFQSNLDFAWKNMRDENGLLSKDWTGREKPESKWLLDQFAVAEMLARLAK